MFIRKYWVPLLVFSIAIVGVGLYLLAIQPRPEPTAEKPPVSPSAGTEPSSDTSQGGHGHGDEWHAGAHAPTAESSSTDVGTQTRTGQLTYHAELLESNPVEALRLQAEERGHWSARWIPPFPPDDHEAQTFARNAYLTLYLDDSTPEHYKAAKAYIEKMNDLLNDPLGARRSDLFKIIWVVVPSVQHHYDPKTGYAKFPSDYFPDHVSDLK